MPNIPQQQTIVQYIANASQTQYTFAFYAPLTTDIQVYYQASNATPIPAVDLLELNTQYTVTYNADPTTGGYITLLFTPTTGYYLTINRQVAASLNTNFSNAQNFNGANLDAALDRLLLLCQQNQNYNLQRNLSYIINTYLPNAAPFTQLPPLPQNYFWVGSGSGVVAAQISTVPSASVLQSMLANNSPGTDGASLIGFWNSVSSVATTVDQELNALLKIGNFLSVTVPLASAVNLTSNTLATVTSLTLTPGDWNLWGFIGSVPGTGTITNAFIGAISPSNSVLPTPDPSIGTIVGFLNGTSSATESYFFQIAPVRVKITTPTTYYLLVQSGFSVSTQGAYGYLAARIAQSI